MTKNQKTVFLLFGEDSYLSNEKLKYWKNGFTKKYGSETNLEIISAKELNIKQFCTDIEAIPFLAEKKMVIIKNFLSQRKVDDQKIVAKSLANTPESTILIFHENGEVDKRTSIYKQIARLGEIEEFKLMTSEQTTKWILNRANKTELKISFTAANYLSNYCSSNLWNLSNELEKLRMFAAGKEITPDMINEIVTQSLSASIFKLTDKIAEKNAKEALKTFQILSTSGEELTKIFFMITRHFRILIQVQDMIEKKENQRSITQKLKQHPFVIQKSIEQSRNLTQDKLKSAYRDLLKIDTDFKTGIIRISARDTSEYKLAIEKFILKCCA